MHNPTPVGPEITTAHSTRTSTFRDGLWAARMTSDAHYRRATCWRPPCREAAGRYSTVRVMFTLKTSEPLYVVAPCHDSVARKPWELDRAILEHLGIGR